MTKSITIRKVPDETRDELAARTGKAGQSLQESLRGELTRLAERPDNRSLLEGIRQRKRSTGTRLAAGRVLALRDSDRR